MRFEDAYEGWTSMRLTQSRQPSCWVYARALFAAPSIDTRKMAWTS